MVGDAGARENGTGRDRDRRDRQLSPAGSSAPKNRSSSGFQPTVRNCGAAVLLGQWKTKRRPRSAVQDGANPALAWTAIPAADSEEIRGSIYYRWFLGYSLPEETPHFSR